MRVENYADRGKNNSIYNWVLVPVSSAEAKRSLSGFRRISVDS